MKRYIQFFGICAYVLGTIGGNVWEPGVYGWKEV